MSKIIDTDLSLVFKDNETKQLIWTYDLRKRIIENIVGTDEETQTLPTKFSDIRVVNEVLNAMDSQTFGVVDRRLKKEEVNVTEDVSSMVKDMLLEIDKSIAESKSTQKETPELSVDYIPTDIVEGEDSIEKIELDIKDFIKEDDNDY